MKKQPVIDTNRCNLCGGCFEMCPEVFIINDNGDYVEVVDLDEYPVDAVNEAINTCPLDCIEWED